MRLSNGGVSFDLPFGWEGQIDAGSGTWRTEPGEARLVASEAVPQPDGAVRRTVAHVANFPLPAERGDFGNGAVQAMRSGDVFISLFEYDPASASTALFNSEGMPRFSAADFEPAMLQKPVPGGSAVQRFFRHSGRAFCLYVVVGSHIDRSDVLGAVNDVVDAIGIT
jgi:hypothetical protein